MSSSGELTTERIGGPWSPMSAADLAHDDDDEGGIKSGLRDVHVL